MKWQIDGVKDGQKQCRLIRAGNMKAARQKAEAEGMKIEYVRVLSDPPVLNVGKVVAAVPIEVKVALVVAVALLLVVLFAVALYDLDSNPVSPDLTLRNRNPISLPPASTNPPVERERLPSFAPSPSTPVAVQLPLPQFQARTTVDPVAGFQAFAAAFVDELVIQSIPKTGMGKDFVLHVYKKESAKVDVKKTDSLINPIMGMVVIEQSLGGAGFDAKGQSQAMVGGKATDTFNFSLDGGNWKYINGHSSGRLSKQDVRDVTSLNRQGISSATLDEDLSNDPRILRVVETVKSKAQAQAATSSLGTANRSPRQ
jgi:hypothetical protein